MVKSTVIVQLEDGENIYKISDKVRVKMKSENPKRANEYIGEIIDIHQKYFRLNCDGYIVEPLVDKIDRIRFARDKETFDNTFNFDD